MELDIFTIFFGAVKQFWPIGLLVFITFLFRLPVVKGFLGEWWVNRALRRKLSADDYQLFKNVTLPTADGTTQIDHVLLSPFGLFVIETKNMKGWIFGTERQARWTQQIYRHKTSFQNPLRQNYKHVETIRELLHLDKNSIFSVIIFTGEAELKNKLPCNVGYLSQGLDYILSKQQRLFDEGQLALFSSALTENRLSENLKTHFSHVQHVKDIVADKKHNKANMCPRCDSELVARKNRKTGASFIGCSSFPKCRYLEPSINIS